ncbi:MAG TPA: hypothetical protein VFN42_01460 [Acetobacteraceae bacterium]|nr:hypothetical protein [Acetobacteraceae bacterium]
MVESRLYCPEEEFTGRLRSRLPMNVLFTFSAEQLQALRTAFGTRFERRHSVDVRWRVRLPWQRYYVVVQCGRDKRVDPRRAQGQGSMAWGMGWLLTLAAGMAGLGWLVMSVVPNLLR